MPCLDDVGHGCALAPASAYPSMWFCLISSHILSLAIEFLLSHFSWPPTMTRSYGLGEHVISVRHRRVPRSITELMMEVMQRLKSKDV